MFSIKETIMRFSSIRTPSVDNLFILAESTFLSFLLHSAKFSKRNIIAFNSRFLINQMRKPFVFHAQYPGCRFYIPKASNIICLICCCICMIFKGLSSPNSDRTTNSFSNVLYTLTIVI